MLEGIKLVCFDLNKTLVRENSWYDLNLALGISHEQDEEWFNQYEAGHLNYHDWMKLLLAEYKKSPQANLIHITEILSRYNYVSGAKEIVTYLQGKGYHIALISGGMDILVDKVAKELGIELSEANNQFVFNEDGKLEEIVAFDAEHLAKLHHLQSFCRKLGIDITECACVGDGDNDIELFKTSQHGITFRGSKIEAEAWKVIDQLEDLHTIL